MIKINPIKTIALATALTAGTVCVAQNRMQGTTKPLVTATQNQNGKEIYNELMKLIEHPEPKVVPGRIWGTRIIHPIDKDKILATYKKVNANNVKDFLQPLNKDDDKAFWTMYRRVAKAVYNDNPRYAWKSEVRDHMVYILRDLANKYGNNVESYIKDQARWADDTEYFQHYIQDAFKKAIRHY